MAWLPRLLHAGSWNTSSKQLNASQMWLLLMKWRSTTCSAEEYCRERLAVQEECWSHFRANVEFPWTLTSELLNWLTKLKCINASGCVSPPRLLQLVREGQHLALIEMCAHRVCLWSFPAGWQVMSRCLSCHWTLYRRRTWAGPTTSSATGSNWKRSSAGCADETRAWRRLWERLSPWAP